MGRNFRHRWRHPLRGSGGRTYPVAELLPGKRRGNSSGRCNGAAPEGPPGPHLFGGGLRTTGGGRAPRQSKRARTPRPARGTRFLRAQQAARRGYGPSGGCCGAGGGHSPALCGVRRGGPPLPAKDGEGGAVRVVAPHWRGKPDHGCRPRGERRRCGCSRARHPLAPRAASTR